MKAILIMVAVILCDMAVMAMDMCPSFAPKAVKEYRRRADAGDAEAQILLANVFEYGSKWGMEVDKVEALKWYRKSAAQDNPYAQYMLGCAYQFGNGVEKNNAEALKWYRKAAEQGLPFAKERLKMFEAPKGKSR